MIYKYLNSVYSKKTIISSVIISLYIIYSLNYSNLTTKGVLGILISLIFVWYIIDKDKSLVKDHDVMISNIIIEIPILKGLKKYEELILFFYKSKVIMKYDYVNYKKSILSVTQMITNYEYIKNNSKNIRFLFDIFFNDYHLSIKHFKNMEFNLKNYNILKEVNILNKLLLFYVDDIILYNNNNLELNGYNIFKNKIDNSILPFNQSTFFEEM